MSLYKSGEDRDPYLQLLYSLAYVSNVQINVGHTIEKGFGVIPTQTIFYPILNHTGFNSMQISNEVNEKLKNQINKEFPLLLRRSRRILVSTGNRFEDGGLSKSQVGRAYSYGEYSNEIVRMEYQIYVMDIINNRLIETNIGFVEEKSKELKGFDFYKQEFINLNSIINFFQTLRNEFKPFDKEDWGLVYKNGVFENLDWD